MSVIHDSTDLAPHRANKVDKADTKPGEALAPNRVSPYHLPRLELPSREGATEKVALEGESERLRVQSH